MRRGREQRDGGPRGHGLAAMARYADAWTELHARISHRFARADARDRAERYLLGLLERVERQNGWQLAEAIGEPGPRGVQLLRARACAAEVPARWVVADAVSGRSHALRRWLEGRERPYPLMIPKTTAVGYSGRVPGDRRVHHALADGGGRRARDRRGRPRPGREAYVGGLAPSCPLRLLAHAYLVVIRQAAQREARGHKGAPILA